MLCAAVVMGMTACTTANLDLCMDEHPHRGQLIVEYDWSGYIDEYPDSMLVMAVRPIFRDKVASRWSTSVNVEEGEDRLYGSFVTSATGLDEIYYAPYEEMTTRDSLFLPAGEWEISSFTYNPETVETTKDFVQDVGDVGEKLFFRLSTYEALPERYSYWHDRNASATWVETQLKQAPCLSYAKVLIDEFANIEQDYKVVLKPVSVAQQVNVMFEARVAEEDIILDSIVCAISGIPQSINLNTMEVDINTTHQTIFETEETVLPDGRIMAEGTVHVLGLLRSATPNMLQGPGILNVSVFVHYDEEVTVAIAPKEEGEEAEEVTKTLRRERRLDGTLNLYRLLTETPSLRYTLEGSVVQTTPTLDLHVHSELIISKTALSNADGALDAWVDETIIEVEN